MVAMERSDARRALWQCSVQGFVAIRSAAQDGIGVSDASLVGVTSGFDGAGLFIAEVASVALAISRAHEIGSAGAQDIIAAWAGAGDVGRRWLAETVRDYVGRQAHAGLMAAIQTAPVPGTAATRKSRQGWSRRTRWCRAILTCGYSDVRDLVAPEMPSLGGVETRRRIQAIAECCHRIPYPEELPATLRPWLVTRY